MDVAICRFFRETSVPSAIEYQHSVARSDVYQTQSTICKRWDSDVGGEEHALTHAYTHACVANTEKNPTHETKIVVNILEMNPAELEKSLCDSVIPFVRVSPKGKLESQHNTSSLHAPDVCRTRTVHRSAVKTLG